jgi:hypothetical protein
MKILPQIVQDTGSLGHSSRQISHAVPVETPLCCAKRRNAPMLHPQLPYEEMRRAYVPSHIYQALFLFLGTV